MPPLRLLEAADACARRAGERAALVAEELALAEIGSETAAQLTATNGSLARGEPRWMARATTSLPVPLSPRIRTVVLPTATSSAAASTSRIAALSAITSRRGRRVDVSPGRAGLAGVARGLVARAAFI